MSARAAPIRLTALMTSTALLGACFSGFNSNVPATQVYMLRPTAASAPAASPVAAGLPPAASVQVLLPRAPAGLGTDGIAVLRSGGRLDYYRGARWAGSSPQLLQTMVIDALRGTQRFALVEAEAGPFASDYVLSMELRDFEAEYADAGPPTVHVAVVCSFGRRSDRYPLSSFTAAGEARAEEDRMQAVVAAFEHATADALAQMAAQLTAAAPR
jgi:cholesterol transport system auxiliary component